MHTGLALITGTEDRQHAYVALSRGTARNRAYVFTRLPAADLGAGLRPAPELDRYDRLTARQGRDLAAGVDGEDGRERAIGVLAWVVGRDGEELSATATRARNLSAADHLGVLYATWEAETTAARAHYHTGLLHDALPDRFRGEPGHKAKWLRRTLHAAELAGRDPADLLADAVAGPDLTGDRDIAAVLDARIRRSACGLPPPPRLPWTRPPPLTLSPVRRQLLTELAEAMTDRIQRIGEHAAAHCLPWAVAALGAVPAGPAGRREWCQGAGVIGAWRELSGHSDPAGPLGPEPAQAAPDYGPCGTPP